MLMTAITAAPNASPFTLVPTIKHLVRTRFPVPGSIFLVEDIQIASLTETGRWQVVRLLLGDGELCIQAVLGDAMHRFVHTREISVGTYVRVDDHQLRVRRLVDEHGESKQIIFLVVHNLSTVGWNRPVQELHKEQQHEQEDGCISTPDEEPVTPQIETSPERKSPSAFGPVSGPPTKAHLSRKPSGKPSPTSETESKHVLQNAATADAFEEFEALTFPVKKPLNPTSKSPTKAPRANTSDTSDKQPMVPIALARDWHALHDLQTPLKLTTLRSIPNLPYQQNWSCNILAIMTYLSPVEASHLPPYKQRTARIADPSTSKQVHLTVFLDPEEFTPTVGNAVLLTGVKNHKYDGGSLKKYASDKMRGKWWIEDPRELKWCDVQGIKAWWAEMEAYLASQLSEEASR
ncbi:hypothetical protein EsDP_00004586 [Epichloe bromicola]|uniref:Cyclin-like F-box n=1 Tax=Epichloe bromicola TaxID=79588 RepID=A0ABQ0CS59_9HYPO